MFWDHILPFLTTVPILKISFILKVLDFRLLLFRDLNTIFCITTFAMSFRSLSDFTLLTSTTLIICLLLQLHGKFNFWYKRVKSNKFTLNSAGKFWREVHYLIIYYRDGLKNLKKGQWAVLISAVVFILAMMTYQIHLLYLHDRIIRVVVGCAIFLVLIAGFSYYEVKYKNGMKIPRMRFPN